MKDHMRLKLLCVPLLFLGVVVLSPLVAGAAAPTGAIFTTLPDGSEVNYNIYASKEDVYLDGGPGPGAPQTAAGLDDGVYVFQVTDPSGKVLLSTDIAACRRFIVTDGIITGLKTDEPVCHTPHLTGLDIDHSAVTVQLMPYNDTPNNGGVYKVWATLVEDYLEGCQAQGVNNGLSVVDCGPPTRRSHGVAHGFIPAESKTDNFKVRGCPREIDVRFIRHGQYVDGLGVIWMDTLGASNTKWSLWAPELDINHEAHVEDVETGTHSFNIFNQNGCTVGAVYVDGKLLRTRGPQIVDVIARRTFECGTIFVDVYCN
jgi:hypothetical protein